MSELGQEMASGGDKQHGVSIADLDAAAAVAGPELAAAEAAFEAARRRLDAAQFRMNDIRRARNALERVLDLGLLSGGARS